jgi:cysteine-S-conjugate beta-lyase
VDPLSELGLDDLRGRTSMKWRRYDADVLPLWVAEMDVLLAEPIATALSDAIARGDTGYPFAADYTEALREFAAARWGWQLDPDTTAIVPDVMLGIVEVLKLVTGPGDAVVLNPPVYPPFFAFVSHLDRRVLDAPLGPDHRLDLVALETAFANARAGGRRAAYLLCSPHNPTGTVHTREELTAVAALADRWGVRVVVDEIHAPVVDGAAEFLPYLSLPGTDDAFALLSASKAWNLAGLKAAMAVAGPRAAKDLALVPEEVSHGPSHLGVIAHCAALRDGGDWLDAVLVGLERNRRLLAELLGEQLPGVRYRPSQATYLAWLDCTDLGLGDDPAAAFLERGRVALSPGPEFGTGGAGHVRLNIATSPDVLREAVRRMAVALG